MWVVHPLSMAAPLFLKFILGGRKLLSYLVPLLNLVEHACSVGMLGTGRAGGAERRLIKDMRYMPEDGHLVAINI